MTALNSLLDVLTDKLAHELDLFQIQERTKVQEQVLLIHKRREQELQHYRETRLNQLNSSYQRKRNEILQVNRIEEDALKDKLFFDLIYDLKELYKSRILLKASNIRKIRTQVLEFYKTYPDCKLILSDCLKNEISDIQIPDICFTTDFIGYKLVSNYETIESSFETAINNQLDRLKVILNEYLEGYL